MGRERVVDQKNEVKRIIEVTHACSEGWHTFTSEHIPGLFLTVHEANLEAAFYDIPKAIEALIFADYKRRVQVRPEITYDEYLVTLPPSHKPTRKYYAIEELRAA